VSAHASFLQLQGQNSEDVDHLGEANPDGAKLDEKERVLLEYVKVLTLEPAKTRDTHVERLRQVGWTDEQIFEASFITSIFAYFNRMADAYGLDYTPGRWYPPALRRPMNAPSTAAKPAGIKPVTRPGAAR
jgi:alkylhydroperoxidase family enzyme